ncbi:MAG: CBS domain-containing protein [Luteimonas sp.]
MELKSLMTANPACCKSGTSLREVAQMMADNDCGMIPVVDDKGMPVGVITDRDIALRVVAKGKDHAACCASDVMTSHVHSVTEDTSLADCCSTMEKAQVRRLPVVDGQGCVCGVVAQADIALSDNASRTAEVVKQVSKPC